MKYGLSPREFPRAQPAREGSIRRNIFPREYCPPREGHTDKQLLQYNPTSEDNTENGHKVTLRNDIMSVLGYTGYTMKYGLNRREFPRVQPEGTPSSRPNTDTVSVDKKQCQVEGQDSSSNSRI